MTMIQSKYDDVCASADELATYVAEVCCTALQPAEVVVIESADYEYRLSVQEEGDTVRVFIRRKGAVPVVWHDAPHGVRLYLCPLLVHLHDKVLSMRPVRDVRPPLVDQSAAVDGTLAEQLQVINAKLDTILEGTK